MAASSSAIDGWDRTTSYPGAVAMERILRPRESDLARQAGADHGHRKRCAPATESAENAAARFRAPRRPDREARRATRTTRYASDGATKRAGMYRRPD